MSIIPTIVLHAIPPGSLIDSSFSSSILPMPGSFVLKRAYISSRTVARNLEHDIYICSHLSNNEKTFLQLHSFSHMSSPVESLLHTQHHPTRSISQYHVFYCPSIHPCTRAQRRRYTGPCRGESHPWSSPHRLPHCDTYTDRVQFWYSSWNFLHTHHHLAKYICHIHPSCYPSNSLHTHCHLCILHDRVHSSWIYRSVWTRWNEWLEVRRRGIHINCLRHCVAWCGALTFLLPRDPRPWWRNISRTLILTTDINVQNNTVIMKERRLNSFINGVLSRSLTTTLKARIGPNNTSSFQPISNIFPQQEWTGHYQGKWVQVV